MFCEICVNKVLFWHNLKYIHQSNINYWYKITFDNRNDYGVDTRIKFCVRSTVLGKIFPHEIKGKASVLL